MKTSKLIETLKVSLEKAGDLDVCYDDGGSIYDVDNAVPTSRLEPRWAKRDLRKEIKYLLLV
jgi:hypothetical protein